METSAILEYFNPLMKFLIEENTKANDCFGWGYEYVFQQFSSPKQIHLLCSLHRVLLSKLKLKFVNGLLV